ncbi:MAG: RibD family protein [Pseudomonadota bacterium]|nr:RibD family protein [Pseudomonadota bacterium]
MKVITNTAITVDGKIGSARYDHVAIGSPVDRQYMSVLRARADAVLVGGRTFRSWPLPLVPDARALLELAASGFPDAAFPPLEGRQWWNVILTRSLDVPKTGRFYSDPRVRPLFYSGTAGHVPSGEVVVGEVSIPGVLADLAARGVETLLVEAGGDLIAQLLQAGVVDELYLTICPLVLGGRSAPTVVDGDGFPFAGAPRLSLAHVHRVGDELFCRYIVER